MWYLVQQDPGETVALGSYDNLDDEELCSTIGLDYNQVNCIELT